MVSLEDNAPSYIPKPVRNCFIMATEVPKDAIEEVTVKCTTLLCAHRLFESENATIKTASLCMLKAQSGLDKPPKSILLYHDY